MEEKTKQLFGYYTKELKPSSEKKVIWVCKKCGLEKEKKFREAVKNSLCLKCSNNNNAIQGAEKRSKSLKEWFKYNNHPLKGTKRPQNVVEALRKASMRPCTEERKKILSEKNSGEGNPMFGKHHNEESLKKMREFQKTNKSIRGKNSNFYGKIYHSHGAWYICKDSSEVWMRSSWEIKFAQYLDINDIEWFYEPKAFPIKYKNKNGTYTPDFFLLKENKFIEI
ncbi:MAG: NUMOD3 domain-containing DNA-binding protein, partial [Paludibacteraceae bacterium]